MADFKNGRKVVSITMLPDFWQAVSLANPIFYMINAFRYGFIGVSDISLGISYAIILGFIAINIIIATMFLRWHWFIDVALGLLLAFAARAFAVAVASREELRGTIYDGRQPVWERL